MQVISDFEPALRQLLPETERLLHEAHLVLHPTVARVLLYGSRGLKGGARTDSDLDLCLLIETEQRHAGAALRRLLRDVLETTLVYWKGGVPVDPVVVFDTRDCRLDCLDHILRDEICSTGGVDCFGLYKLRRAGGHFVIGKGVEMARLRPILPIWRNPLLPLGGSSSV